MKKLVLVLLIVSTAVFAQGPNKGRKGPNHEKIKALKTAHITSQLDLTSAEAEKFWPIYNDYDSKLMELRKNMRSENMGKLHKGNIDNLTDEEANEIIDKMLEMKTTELDYRKKLAQDLRGVIPPTKIIKLQRAEESFKRMLLERLKQKGKDKEKMKSKNRKK
jgi:Skp family chaperone for outer membrane proteins